MDIFPQKSLHDLACMGGGDAVFCRQHFESHSAALIASTNFSHALLGEFSHRMALACCISAFCRHVLHVVFVRADEQMIGAAALAIVAMMQNLTSLRNRAGRKSVSCPVSRDGFVAEVENSVSRAGKKSSGPLPALITICDAHLEPKITLAATPKVVCLLVGSARHFDPPLAV